VSQETAEKGAREVYQVLTSSGLRSITKSFARLYIMNLLYHENQGLTSTMIYCQYKKDLAEQDVPEEMTRSRSNIIDHLNDLEAEGLIEKGIFKQYILTEKGRRIFEITLELARELETEKALGISTSLSQGAKTAK
jgi:DNA-binding HxlR family transcriptional regulator